MNKYFTIIFSIVTLCFGSTQTYFNFSSILDNSFNPDKPPERHLTMVKVSNSAKGGEIDIATWDTLKAPYPISDIYCGMSCNDDSGYLYGIGGQSPIIADVYCYHMRTDSWVALPSMPGVNANQTAAWWTDSDGSPIDSSCIFVVGRYNNFASKTSYRWIRATNTWDTIPQYPNNAFAGNMSAVIGDTLYLISRGSADGQTRFYRYAIRNGTWNEGPRPADTNNFYGAICSYGGKIWQLGGWFDRKTFQCYRPGSGWTLLPSPLGNVGGSRGCIAGHSGKIFAWGGGNGWIAWDGMAIFDTANNIWNPEPNIPKPWLGAFYGAIPDTLGQIGLHVAAGYHRTSTENNIHARGLWTEIIANDVGCTKIDAPSDTIIYGLSITPACSVYNYGENSENYLVRMKIGNYFNDTVRITGHAPGTYKQITFSSWTFTQLGTYVVSCSTELLGDMNNANDKRLGTVTIKLPNTLWNTMEPIPSGISGKNPKYGSCLAGITTTGKIYFLKATKTPELFVFSPPIDTGMGNWLEAEPMPLGMKPDDGRNPNKGAAITAYKNRILVLRGNRTLGFWEYITNPDSIGWNKLANIPAGNRPPKYGTGLVAVSKGDTDYIFAMKGSNTTEFYLYNFPTKIWSPTASPPTGISGRVGYRKGSCLCFDGNEYIYILKGKYGDFFRYRISDNSWEELERYDASVYLNRDGRKKKLKYGASLVYFDDYVYMLKGSNTNEVWLYDVLGDSWLQMDADWDIPDGEGKRVKGGGNMIVFDNFFYVTKGNNTTEFYRLCPMNIKSQIEPKQKTENTMNQNNRLNDIKLLVSPNPTKDLIKISYNLSANDFVNIRLYNINGELVKSYVKPTSNQYGSTMIETKTLPSGIYILRINSGETSVTKKLIIEK